MKKHLLTLCYLLAIVAGCAPKTTPENSGVTKIIFETDMGNDVDDALAIDMLYKYLDAKKIDLLAVMSNKSSDYSAQYIDLMNTWYGYSDIPIGIVRNGVPSDDAIAYGEVVATMKDEAGNPVWARTVENTQALPDAHILYRRILAAQPDGSVNIVSVGFSTNLARLLDTPADDISPMTGVQLVAQKVKLLCTMAGGFDNPELIEYNVVKDVQASKKVFSEWPTPIVTSPFEVGIAINYPGASIENDFGWAPLHPAVEAYKCYQPMPYDRPTWDLTAVLYTVEGPSWFGISPDGTITVADDGSTSFTPGTDGNHRYLTVDDAQADSIRNYFVELITSKPLNFESR